MLLTGIASRKCSLFPVMDNSKYNLCAGISNEINSSFHVQPSRIRNPAKSLWKYILYRKGERGGEGGWGWVRVQMGNVSWSQPFRRSSFPAKADKEKSSLMLTRWFGQQQGVENVFFLNGVKYYQNLPNYKLYEGGVLSWLGIWNICWHRQILEASTW